MPHPTRNTFLLLLLSAPLFLALAFSSACGAFQSSATEAPALPPPPVEAEPVDPALSLEIDRLVAEGSAAERAALSVELRPAVQLLAHMRSPRAASLARELQRLEAPAPDDSPAPDEAPEDTWGGTQLLAWLRAIQAWELQGAPNFDAFRDLPCEAPRVAVPVSTPSEGEAPDDAPSEGEAAAPNEAPEALSHADLTTFGACVLRATNHATLQRDADLTPILRAALGELPRRTHTWLRARALPTGDAAIFEADPSLRAALAWTQLPASDAPFVGNGLLVTLRSTGVSVSQRPALHGHEALEALPASEAGDVPAGSGDAAEGDAPDDASTCAWPGEALLRFTAAPDEATRNAAFDALEARFLACSPGAPSTARVAIDAGLRWADIAPVLQKLITLERAPSFLVYEVQGRALSALPITLSDGAHGGVCGIEAHLRRDGVVLRGGGASVSLHAWAEPDTLTRLSERALEAHTRCDAPALVRVFVDDPSVDWGIVVRVLERMSWPQTCAEAGCLNTFLMVGDPHAGR